MRRLQKCLEFTRFNRHDGSTAADPDGKEANAMTTIVKYAIYPPIGIARVGSSTDEYYLTPELPGHIPDHEELFKDAQGRIKRQAARFRIYGPDADDNPVREIVVEDNVSIKWEVHLANRKAINYKFENAMDLGSLSNAAEKRNKSVIGADRSQLIIDPGSRTISGRAMSGPQLYFDTGFFYAQRVPLGELRTDDQGRLIVLGGFGKSASLDGSAPTTFANNDGWYDDTSDGPVRATIQIDGQSFDAEPAFVAVCPPNYGQGLYGVVTMYDVLYDVFCRSEVWNLTCPGRPNFWQHIYPIFKRMADNQWVNEGIHFLFGPGSPHDFSDQSLIAQLSDSSDASKPLRAELFDWFRDPDEAQAKPVDLPPFYGDGFSEHLSAGIVGLALPRTQYQWLKSWADGDFDSPAPAAPPTSLEPVAEQPVAITRAHLDDCLGGPFHPGIELTWTMRVPSMWKAPFRLKILARGVEPRDDYGPVLTPSVAIGVGGVVDASGPGTLTKWMGVPWQTDEASCMSGYTTGSYLSLPSFWAARVPNQVFSERSYERASDASLPTRQRQKHFDYRELWLRYFRSQYVDRIADMVERWDKVGIVAPRNAPPDLGLNVDRVWIETEADYDSLFAGDSTFQQLLVAENAVEPTEGISRAATATFAAMGEVPEVGRPEKPSVLSRDQM